MVCRRSGLSPFQSVAVLTVLRLISPGQETEVDYGGPDEEFDYVCLGIDVLLPPLTVPEVLYTASNGYCKETPDGNSPNVSLG